MSIVELVGLLFYGAFFIGIGVFAFYLGRRMKNDDLPPNGTLGTRTLFSLESEENWYLTQRATAMPTIVLGYAFTGAGVIVIAGAVMEYFCPSWQVSDGSILISLTVITIAVIWFWVPYFRAKRSFLSNKDDIRRDEK